MTTNKKTTTTAANAKPEITSYEVSKGLYLNAIRPVKAASIPQTVNVPSNHVLVIDCSGSMGGELPQIRAQLKAKLPKLLKDGDTVSIVWFSGKGQCGTLVEGEPVPTLADLKVVNEAIDRWLRPVGMTGFKEPLEEVKALATRLQAKYAGNALSLFFMSDGCDNQWNRVEILKAAHDLAPMVQAAAIVEYGYYADRVMLTLMAEEIGGQLLFSQSFAGYDAVFTERMTKQATGGAAKINLDLPSADYLHGFAFTAKDGDINTYAVTGLPLGANAGQGSVLVPADTDVLWCMTPSAIGEVVISLDENCAGKYSQTLSPSTLSFTGYAWEAVSAAYAAISLMAGRMRSEIVRPLLKAVGDVALVNQYASCFGKQAYSSFTDAAKTSAFEPKARWTKGRDVNAVPRDDAFTVLDMLKLLSNDEDNLVVLGHPSFAYSRIGRKAVDASDMLTAEERAEIEELTGQMAGEKNAGKVAMLSARVSEITNKPGALVFTEDAEAAGEGYSVTNLTYNESRPNVSILVKRTGKVDLKAPLATAPAMFKAFVPEAFESFRWRNYAVVKDGIVNVDVLPVKLTHASRQALVDLMATGRVPTDLLSWDNAVALLNVSKLPVVNAQMVKTTSARALFEAEYALKQAKAAQKVFGWYNRTTPKAAVGGMSQWSAAYTPEAKSWLEGLGLTAHGGFSPRSLLEEATDFYVGKELKVSLKGLSSLPEVEKTKERMVEVKANPNGKAKLTPSMALLAPYIAEVDAFLASDAYVKAAMQPALFTLWIEGKAKEARAKARKGILAMAQIKFAVIVGQTWFSEFASLDENTLTVTIDGADVVGTVEMAEVQVSV